MTCLNITFCDNFCALLSRSLYSWPLLRKTLISVCRYLIFFWNGRTTFDLVWNDIPEATENREMNTITYMVIIVHQSIIIITIGVKVIPSLIHYILLKKLH